MMPAPNMIDQARPNRGLTILAWVLVLLGLLASAYLTKLYLAAHSGSADNIDTFCTINEEFNCVTVALCEYSQLFGIPVAVYGVEFYLLLLLILAVSLLPRSPIKNWPPFLYLAGLASLPACAVLWYLSVYVIESVCIVCCLVYAVNVGLVVAGGIPNRFRLGRSLASVRDELKALCAKSYGFGCALIGLGFVLGQFIILPNWFAFDSKISASLTVHQHDPASFKEGLSIGSPDAPLQVEEFTDFQCPYCARAHQVLLEVSQEYPGAFRITHRDYPLDHHCNPSISTPFHPRACEAARYARCAARQNLFWELEVLLFANQRKLSSPQLDRLSTEVGLDQSALKECLKDPSIKQEILADIQEGQERGLKGTPTFFVNGKKYVGLRDRAFWTELAEGVTR